MVSIFYWFVLKQFLGVPIVFVLNKCISFRSLIDILRETRQKLFSDIWNIAFKRPFWTESATYRLTIFPSIIIYRNESWQQLQAYYIKIENVWYDMIHASFEQLLELILSWLLKNTSPKSQNMSTYTKLFIFNKNIKNIATLFLALKPKTYQICVVFILSLGEQCLMWTLHHLVHR